MCSLGMTLLGILEVLHRAPGPDLTDLGVRPPCRLYTTTCSDTWTITREQISILLTVMASMTCPRK